MIKAPILFTPSYSSSIGGCLSAIIMPVTTGIENGKISYLAKSKIGSTARQKRTLQALGLGKVNSTNEVEATPQILGMINKVQHLVAVEEI